MLGRDGLKPGRELLLNAAFAAASPLKCEGDRPDPSWADRRTRIAAAEHAIYAAERVPPQFGLSMVSDWYWLLVFWWRKLVWLLRGRPRISRVEKRVPDDRTIRLFVSSTFVDMQEERRTLQEDVFPIVRRFLWERGINFVYVDLRWGVTREEVERGDVL